MLIANFVRKTVRYTLPIVLLMAVSACYKGQSVDLIVHNARIHIMDEKGTVAQAMALRDGKIVEVGPERQILNKYSANETIDAGGRDVYPGLTDCHGHMLSYAEQKLNADLYGSKSFEEVLVRLEKYQSKNKRTFIVGRGWDQSLWSNKAFPTNEKLNALFPTIPVCLTRVDGHALLANDAMLKLAGIDASTKIDGGIIHVENGKCTGLLVDNAMLSVYNQIPEYTESDLANAFLEIEKELFQYGITAVHEAGIDHQDIAFLKKMIDKYNFKLSVYAMLMPSTENFAFAEKNGIYTHKNLTIRSFKVVGDGALGSRGAFLKKSYSDAHDHHGVLTTPVELMKRVAAVAEKTGYQMNTHAIGDSTNRIMLEIYKGIFEVNRDHRWRIEHAQVIDLMDFDLFGKYGVFPSVQPSHAVSDQRWAEERLGKERIKGAYAYRTLLNQYGMLAIGTDFPIEPIDPFNTLHAAVTRQNMDNEPAGGFYPEQSITIEQCMRGMTIWAAFASFKENSSGSLEKGKEATFVIFDKPVSNEGGYKANFARMTFIQGRKVYGMD
jgi:predicted amidohydrolase YtcJ